MPWQVVHSQQFTTHGPGSQRFAVNMDETVIPVAIPIRETQPWDAAQQAMKQEIIRRERQIEEAERARIRAHEPREVNPWVERMGWAGHLFNDDHPTLRA